VTLYNDAAGYVETRLWSGVAWDRVDQVLDGSLLVKGSIAADAMRIGNSSNLLFNPGFDAGLDGWAWDNGNISSGDILFMNASRDMADWVIAGIQTYVMHLPGQFTNPGEFARFHVLDNINRAVPVAGHSSALN
jgi:hypothetical protein